MDNNLETSNNPNLQLVNQARLESSSYPDYQNGVLPNNVALNNFEAMFSGNFQFPPSISEISDEKSVSEDYYDDADETSLSYDVESVKNDDLVTEFSEQQSDNKSESVNNFGKIFTNIEARLMSLTNKINSIYKILKPDIENKGGNKTSKLVLKDAMFTPTELSIDFDFQYFDIYKTETLILFFIPLKSFKFSIRQLTQVKLNCGDLPTDYEVLLPGPVINLDAQNISILVFICPPSE